MPNAITAVSVGAMAGTAPASVSVVQLEQRLEAIDSTATLLAASTCTTLPLTRVASSIITLTTEIAACSGANERGAVPCAEEMLLLIRGAT
jgi:hypothetical protein